MQHHPVFVVLSLLVAVLGSWTALDLFRRVRTHLGRARLVWLAAAATAMGASIWSMHFVAMLGFDPGSAVSYDPFLTLLSLLLAIGATLGAFFVAARERARAAHVVVAGAAMGAGICAMHYVGMAAIRTTVSLGYEPRLVALSLLVAVAASIAALMAAWRERSLRWRLAAALILGAAIAGMHYTAMAALRLTSAPGMGPASMSMTASGAPPFMLAVSVAGGTLAILCLALMASLYDQRGNILSALEAGGVGYWELDLRDRALHMSSRGKEIFGARPDEAFSYAQMLARLPPEEQARRDQLIESAVRTGSDYDSEYRLADEARWVNLRGRVLKDPSGRARRMIGVVLDVTDRHEAFAAVSESERRQRLLIHELNHRVKNTLATIQSIAAQTARRADSVEAFRASFEARLIALSSTHNALTRGGWETASLRELLLRELEPYPPEQVSLDGPDIELQPRQALALGMVFHELATNAAKYGALSAAGCVTVAWALRSDGAGGRVLALDWRERGGPPVRPPASKGFGSRLIAGSIERELGGRATLSYETSGLACVLVVPLPAHAEVEEAPGHGAFPLT